MITGQIGNFHKQNASALHRVGEKLLLLEKRVYLYVIFIAALPRREAKHGKFIKNLSEPFLASWTPINISSDSGENVFVSHNALLLLSFLSFTKSLPN